MRTHRKERVAAAIQEIVSDAIARRINDPRLAPLTTVSRVTVSGDLAIATVFLTVVGEESVARRSLEALRHARGFVQRLVAEQLSLRQCPELRFQIDESAKKVRETMQILEENRRREPHVYEERRAASDEGRVASGEKGGTEHSPLTTHHSPPGTQHSPLPEEAGDDESS